MSELQDRKRPCEFTIVDKHPFLRYIAYVRQLEAIMDKIMSTRVDEAVIRHIGMLADRLGTSKKAVIENAVRYYLERIEEEEGFDLLSHTFGCWERSESASETVRVIKDTMRKSQERYKR